MTDTPVEVLTRHFASKPHAEDAITALEDAGYRIIREATAEMVDGAWWNFDAEPYEGRFTKHPERLARLNAAIAAAPRWSQQKKENT